MTHRRHLCLSILIALTLAPALLAETHTEQRAQAQKLFKQGNWKEALAVFRKLCLETDNDPKLVSQDLHSTAQCYQRLGRQNELDAFREAVIKRHANNWRLLYGAAQNYLSYNHWGFIVAGKFRRGNNRGGGQYANSWERDRVRSLQLMNAATQQIKGEPASREVAGFYSKFASMYLRYRGYSAAWRLQYLSDLSKLPDYEPGYGYYGHRGSRGAPVDSEGNPIYHKLPKSYDAARTDGERWRWLLLQAMEADSNQTHSVMLSFARFHEQQFGVQTMAYYGRYLLQPTGDDKKDESGPFAVHTLGEDETIAKLATGIKRFKLPDEFNYIKIYQRLNRHIQLAQIFQNRRQYPKAAAYWRQANRPLQARQITGNWGVMEPVTTFPAGQGATIDYRFRNGKKVHFQAQRVDVKQLLADVKSYLEKQPGRLDWSQVNLGQIGHRIVIANQRKYLSDKAADWSVDLKTPPKHFDRRITVKTPLKKAGAYLLTASMDDGNISRLIIWVADTAIVRKPLHREPYYYVADAVTGKPLAGVKLDFFGYRQNRVPGTRTYNITTKSFSTTTDKDGQVFPGARQTAGMSWLATATTDAGRLAYIGFQGVWHGRRYDHQYNQTKVVTITDRPVYRPKHTVKYKFWIRQSQYDKGDVSQFANRQFQVQINDPKGQKVLQRTVTSDEYGGVHGEWSLPADATLGQYHIFIKHKGGASFRVEEYKKPEFLVSVAAPKVPVKLGEKVSATIKATYYFGAPVTKGTVKYKVLRFSHSGRWYPKAPWDWFYGSGYWWFAYDYSWYPGWRHWGCKRPAWWWWGSRQTPPEVVAEGQAKLDHDGQLKLQIDTAAAKMMHGDLDHRYQITAEVRDESRRTIVGTGTVLVARRPFKVYSWVDRGHYRTGQTIHASFSAQTLDNRPVQGKGKLRLLRVTYDAQRKPIENEVQAWELDTNDEGRAKLQLKASKAGQYRLSYKVTDSKKHTIEGGYVFMVRGDGSDGRAFRFNHLELITDKREYAPGERVKLMVNTDRTGGTVLLFIRPTNSAYLRPQVIRLTGKSTITEIPVTQKDMPNFFVEALTVADGKVHSETREILVPPAKRVIKVKVLPSKQAYKPGEAAEVQVQLTGLDGKPYVGSTVITIYDKALEYISGGSNVRAIRPFFWKWRRRHYPRTQHSLQRWSRDLLRKGETRMQTLGLFGHLLTGPANEKSSSLKSKPAKGRSGGVRPAGVVKDGASEESDKQDAGETRNARTESPSQPDVQPTIRKNFADTAYWNASPTTDSSGRARVTLKMPENLTGWKIKVWAMGHGTRVGEGTTEVLTTKDLLLRLQAPRFFVQKDEVVLSANVHNYLKTKKRVKVQLELEGPCLKQMTPLERIVTIEAKGELRVDWRVTVVREGTAIVRMKAITDEESDGMEMRFPAYVHGMDKMVAQCSVIRPDRSQTQLRFNVPQQRRIDSARLEVRYSPTLAAAMVDALPYLASYPYGCTEQTLNRFLPTVITQKVLQRMGVSLKDIQAKRTNLNAQEIGDDSKRAKQWKRYAHNPVFDEAELARMVAVGVQRLTNMQLSDGGWGWFSGWGERSYPHTTAYVVHGLQVAMENDVRLPAGMVERGVAWLERYQALQVQLLRNWPKKTNRRKQYAGNLDAMVYMVLADAKRQNAAMRDFLYRDRNQLAVYAKSMLGMAFHKQGHAAKVAMLVRNIEQFLVEDEENQTAYLKLPNDGYWWYWYGSEYEAHAYYLKLLSRVDPKGRKGSRIVKYLLNNRKHSTYWKSTRDTAVCVEAFADFIKASGEDKPEMTVEILVNGRKFKEVQINSKNLFSFDNKLVLEGDAIGSGEQTVEVRRKGQGPVYVNAYMSYFTLEDYIPKAGLEIKVERRYYLLKKVAKTIKVAGSRGQALDQKVEKFERVPIKNMQTLKSGQLVEIELIIESKNDYEYLIFEDMKAAGFEPYKVRSGYHANGLGAYMELRDNRVCFFVRSLARGKNSIAYRMRAEIPGKFSALPTRAYAMYAPELRANSDEIKLQIED